MKRIRKRDRRPPPPVSCGWDSCDVTCKNSWELNGHITVHLEQFCPKPNSTLDCPWTSCDYQTSCLKSLERHVYYHGYHNSLLVMGKFEMDLNPSVPKCNLVPDKRDKIPPIDSDFRCEWTDCERTFTSIVEFQDHIVQHASFEYEMKRSPEDERPKIKCNWQFCQKQLDNKYRLVEHICKHSNKKHAACWQCGELFRTRTTFFDHCKRQPQNNTYKFQCAQCFKYFGTEKLLRAHEVKHFNCYKCSMCDMTCISSSSLATHIRYRHLKDRPFKCSKCDHRSVRKTDLVKHFKYSHTKEIYRCKEDGCDYAVRTHHLLRRHHMEVHENCPYIYICHYCDELFKNGKSLSGHLKKLHKIEHSSGHKRFTYRIDENGFYGLQTMRIESLDVINQILSPKADVSSDIKEEKQCYEIVSLTNENNERTLVSDNNKETIPVGKVVISLPTLDCNEKL